MKSSVRSDIVTPLALRGPALDALTTLCASIGIGIDDELSADDWASPAKEALCALRMIAKSERIVEGLSGATATAARSARTAIVRSFKRAEVADADLAALCAALGLEPGASVADMIKAAEGMKKPAEPKVEAAAPAGDTEATRGLRSDLAILRSQHAEAAAELVVLRKERLADRSEKWLDGETKARKLALRAEDRAELLAIIDEAGEEKGRSLVLKSLATRSAPPVGQVIKGASAETDPTAESDGVSDAAIEAELPAIEAAFPKEPAHMKYARARKAALRKKNGR